MSKIFNLIFLSFDNLKENHHVLAMSLTPNQYLVCQKITFDPYHHFHSEKENNHSAVRVSYFGLVITLTEVTEEASQIP